MSYNDLNTNYNPSTIEAYGYCKGPMALDIAAIKYIYGLNQNLNNDNNIYEITDINAFIKIKFSCLSSEIILL